jgi:hypothetical protein
MNLPKAVPAQWRWMELERVRPGHVVFEQDDVSHRRLLAFGDTRVSHLVGMDAVRGLPRAQPPDTGRRVLELAAAESLQLELGEPIAPDSPRINPIGCVGISVSGPVLCALGGVDRWGEVPEYFHLTSWKPLGLTYPACSTHCGLSSGTGVPRPRRKQPASARISGHLGRAGLAVSRPL